MKPAKTLPALPLTHLTPLEMRQISGGGIWDKMLTALMGVGLGAFYDMGKQEGRLARQRISLIQTL